MGLFKKIRKSIEDAGKIEEFDLSIYRNISEYGKAKKRWAVSIKYFQWSLGKVASYVNFDKPSITDSEVSVHLLLKKQTGEYAKEGLGIWFYNMKIGMVKTVDAKEILKVMNKWEVETVRADGAIIWLPLEERREPNRKWLISYWA